jgi:hypothetical protein
MRDLCDGGGRPSLARRPVRRAPHSLPRAVFSLAAFAFLACEPETRPPASELPLTLEEVKGEGGQSCGRALAVIHTDYVSTSVSLLSLEGDILSAPFFSSGSRASALNAPLGGDVALPSSRTDELVLLDRYPTSVLTFVNPETAEVRGQLDVGHDFAANPHDYLPLTATRALVSRYDRNPNAAEPEGSDLIVIDSQKLTVKSTISLASTLTADEQAEGVVPHPSHLVSLGNSVVVSVTAHTKNFKDAAEGRLVLVDDPLGDTRLRVVRLPELKNCSVLALSPSQKELSVGCSGLLDASDQASPDFSGIVRLRITERDGQAELTEVDRITASELKKGPVGFSLAYFDETHLLATSYGALEGDDAGRPDSLLSFSLQNGLKEPRILLESKSEAFTLGAIACNPGCARCFLADADRAGVQRIDRGEGPDEFKLKLLPIEDDVGLPPRGLGWL